jgi:hypothetical protein
MNLRGLRLASLRCTHCVYLKQGFCSKIGEAVPNRLAKLFYGGAESLYSGTLTYPSECGIEKKQKRGPEKTLEIFTAEEFAQEIP